jgi:hypothetical protein
MYIEVKICGGTVPLPPPLPTSFKVCIIGRLLSLADEICLLLNMMLLRNVDSISIYEWKLSL